MAKPNAGADSTARARATTPETAAQSDNSATKILMKLGFISRQKEPNEAISLIIERALQKIILKVSALNTPAATTISEGLRAVICLLMEVDDPTPDGRARTDTIELIKAQGSRLSEQLEKLTNIIEASNTRASNAEDRLSELADKVSSLETTVKTQTTMPLVNQRTDSRPVTFVQAVAAAPARHSDAVARVAMINRQVVIHGTGANGDSPLKDLSEIQILAKAHMAVELMAQEGIKEAEDVKFLHARKTARGGAVLVTHTEEAAKWLRQEVTVDQFAERMGGTTRAKADLYMLIAEYVPTTFEPGVFTAFKQVERENGLANGAIREARYIKQVERRKEGQRSAHMFMGFTDSIQANTALRNGLIIEGKKVFFRKHRIDPYRCLKCQQIGANHRAADCKANSDICGRCAEAHKTSDCQVVDPAKFKCANCKGANHASTDRNCPIFLEKLKATHARFPDYQYRFFPTQDPDTWELEEYGIPPANNSADDSRRNDTQAYGAFAPSGYSAKRRTYATQERQNRQEQARRWVEPSRRDNGWPADHRAGERGAPHAAPPSGANMRQSTLEAAFARGTASNEAPAQLRDQQSQWGNSPLTEEVEPLRSDTFTPSPYA